ncbi:unnamed protein product, partial [Ascophyllum nodosum]
GLTKEVRTQPKRPCNLDQQCKAPDLLTFGDCGQDLGYRVRRPDGEDHSGSQQDWTDLVRADCCQDGHPLELLKRIKGRLDGAVPARKGEGQDTAGPASEPEAVGEDLAGGEPSAEDSPDGLAEQ